MAERSARSRPEDRHDALIVTDASQDVRLALEREDNASAGLMTEAEDEVGDVAEARLQWRCIAAIAERTALPERRRCNAETNGHDVVVIRPVRKPLGKLHRSPPRPAVETVLPAVPLVASFSAPFEGHRLSPETRTRLVGEQIGEIHRRASHRVSPFGHTQRC